MPLFWRDIKGVGIDALQSPLVVSVFENPFISAAIGTLVVLAILFIVAVDMMPMDYARAALFIYIALVVVLFLNNRYLLQNVTRRGGAEEFFAFSDVKPDITEQPQAFRPGNYRAPTGSYEPPMPTPAPMPQPQPRPSMPTPPQVMQTASGLNNDALAAAYPTNYLG